MAPACLGNFLGNRVNSMVSGPNFRRRSVAFADVRLEGKNTGKNGRIGFELVRN